MRQKRAVHVQDRNAISAELCRYVSHPLSEEVHGARMLHAPPPEMNTEDGR